MTDNIANNPKLGLLYHPYLEILCGTTEESLNPSFPGHYREVSPDLGKGYYWYFPIDDMMAVNIVDLELHTDMTMSYDVPDFFCFGKYNHTMASYFYEKGPAISALSPQRSRILGYAWKHSYFSELIKADQHVRAVGISLLPEAVTQLGSRFGCDPYALAAAISELDGNQVIPGLDEVFETISNIHPCGPSTRVFYESKIAEAAALLIEWWYQKKSNTYAHIRPVDRTSLNIAIEYINDHLSDQITLDDLCLTACMSASKLTGLFKAAEERTPMEYVRELRLEKACKMLAYGDSSLGEIASNLGFSHQGSFSESFKTQYGLTPLSYRKTHSRQYSNSSITPTVVLQERYRAI